MKIESTASLDELPELPPGDGGDGDKWQSHLSPPWLVIPVWGRHGRDFGAWPVTQVVACEAPLPVGRQRPLNPEDVRCRYCGVSVRLDLGWWVSTGERRQRAHCKARGFGHGHTHWPITREVVYGAAWYSRGEIDRWAFAAYADLVAALDALAHAWWRHHGEYQGVVPIGPLPEEYYGAFSWDREEVNRWIPATAHLR